MYLLLKRPYRHYALELYYPVDVSIIYYFIELLSRCNQVKYNVYF